MHAKSLQSCPTLCNIMDCSPPDSSVHGISQARILEWVAMPSCRGFSQPRELFSELAGRFFTTSTTWKATLTYGSPTQIRDSKKPGKWGYMLSWAEERDRETSKEEGNSNCEKRKYLVDKCLLANQVSLSDENVMSGNSSLPDISPFLIYFRQLRKRENVFPELSECWLPSTQNAARAKVNILW